MSEFKGTPGPWLVEGTGIRALVRDEINGVIVAVRHRLSAGEHEANAHLISAAPENYASNVELAVIVRELCAVYRHPLPLASLARSDAAIAKATGAGHE